MNTHAFQRRVGGLALLALLLLVLVPTAGRLVDATADGAHAWHGGHAGATPADPHAAHAARSGGRETPRPAPGDADCDYCPLLASLLGPATILLLAAAGPRAPAITPLRHAPRRAWLHPCGLGSRGPPLQA